MLEVEGSQDERDVKKRYPQGLDDNVRGGEKEAGRYWEDEAGEGSRAGRRDEDYRITLVLRSTELRHRQRVQPDWPMQANRAPIRLIRCSQLGFVLVAGLPTGGAEGNLPNSHPRMKFRPNYALGTRPELWLL